MELILSLTKLMKLVDLLKEYLGKRNKEKAKVTFEIRRYKSGNFGLIVYNSGGQDLKILELTAQQPSGKKLKISKFINPTDDPIFNLNSLPSLDLLTKGEQKIAIEVPHEQFTEKIKICVRFKTLGSNKIYEDTQELKITNM